MHSDFFLIPQIFSGLHVVGGWPTIITGGIAFSLISLIIKPILKVITLPLNIITFGFFSFLINAILLYILTVFVPQINVTAFTFPGIMFSGFVVPPIYFNLIFAYIVISFSFSVLVTAIEWIFN